MAPRLRLLAGAGVSAGGAGVSPAGGAGVPPAPGVVDPPPPPGLAVVGGGRGLQFFFAKYIFFASVYSLFSCFIGMGLFEPFS